MTCTVKRIETGEDAGGQVETPAWRISDKCGQLIRVIPIAKRDDVDKEKIESFDGDDPLQGASYGLYAIFGKPAEKPRGVQLAEVLATAPNNTQKAIVGRRFDVDWDKSHKPACTEAVAMDTTGIAAIAFRDGVGAGVLPHDDLLPGETPNRAGSGRRFLYPTQVSLV